MKVIVFLALLNAFMVGPIQAQEHWKLYEETYISGTISGSIQQGHVFKTVSGNFYEIAEPYINVVVLIMPKVTVLSDGEYYKLIIEDVRETIFCTKLNDAESNHDQKRTSSRDIIESKIDDTFNGYNQGNIYKLTNGQIWEQISVNYRYRYKYRPDVLIIQNNGVFRMKIADMDDWITVRRIK